MTNTTFAGISMLSPSPGDWLEITDADPARNPNGYLVYIQYQESPIETMHAKGFIKLPSCPHMQDIELDMQYNQLVYFKEKFRPIEAQDGFTNNIALLPDGSNVKFAIEMTELAYYGGVPQWQYNYMRGAVITYDSPIDLQFITLQLEADSKLRVPNAGSLYYCHLGMSAECYVGDGSSIYWITGAQHAIINIGEGVYQGADQGVGVGFYYLNVMVHGKFTCGDDCSFDGNYVTIDDAGECTFGEDCSVSAPVVVGKKSKLTIGDDATITKNIDLHDCSSFEAGNDFALTTKSLYIYSGVYIPPVGNSISWPGGSIYVDGSTQKFNYDCGSDVSPDMESVKWGGEITISCTGSSPFTVDELQNLRPNCKYKFKVAAGKHILFAQSGFFKLNNGVTFDGQPGDFIFIETDSTATAGYEISRYNA